MSLVPFLTAFLDPGGADRVVDRRVCADEQHDFCLGDVHDRVRHGAGADAFQQCEHRRCMAQPRAVVDIVAAEPRAHELLEEVGLFVAALGRTEAGQRLAAVLVAYLRQFPPSQVERFLPAGFAEHVLPRFGRHVEVPVFGASARRIRGRVRRCGWCA
jgi:hypothetical protein